MIPAPDKEPGRFLRAQQAIARLPQMLQRGAVLFMTLLILITFLMSNLYALLWQSSDWMVGAVLPAVVAHLTNVERANAAVGELTRSPLLDTAARLKAEHMAAEGYFAHNSPGGITPWYWFDKVGYKYAHAGENLAVHFNDSEEVVRAWMDSPSHRDNIVAGKYTEIGIGTAKGRYQGFDTVFVVQMFGTPTKTTTVPSEPLPPPPPAALPVAAVDSDSVSTPVATAPVTPPVVASAPAAPVVLAEEITTPVLVNTETVREIEPVGATIPVMLDDQGVPAEARFASEIATSSGLEPDLSPEFLGAGTTAPKLAIIATQPYRILQIAYVLIGSVVFLLLVISIIFGWHRHNTRAIIYGVGLLILMSLLFAFHVYATRGVLIV